MMTRIPLWTTAFLALVMASAAAQEKPPTQTADLTVHVVAMHYTFTSRPIDDVTVIARYRAYDFEITSDPFLVTDTVSSVSTCPPGRHHVFDIDLRTFDAEVSYTPQPYTALRFGYTRENIGQTFRHTDRTEEDKVRFSADLTGTSWLTLRGMYADYVPRDTVSFGIAYVWEKRADVKTAMVVELGSGSRRRRFQFERQSGNDKDDRLRFGCQYLVRPSLQITEAPADACRRHDPSADFVADHHDVPRPRRLGELANGAHQNVVLAPWRRASFALEEIRQPEGQALDEYGRVHRRCRAHDLGNRFGFLDGGP